MSCDEKREQKEAAVEEKLSQEAADVPPPPPSLHARIMLAARLESRREGFEWSQFKLAITAAAAAGLLLLIGTQALQMLEGMRRDAAANRIPPETYRVIAEMKTMWGRVKRRARDISELPTRPLADTGAYRDRAVEQIRTLALGPLEQEAQALKSDLEHAALFLADVARL
jgi:hypothetical protein